MTTHRFGVDLSGLMPVLGENLYSSRDSGIRELIQNASDSIVRRRVDDGLLPADYQPRIDIELDAEKAEIAVTDNGAGMNEEECQTRLATIGSSGTREFRASLGPEHELADAAIGQFGLGFLAALTLADQIEVQSRSCFDAPAIQFACGDDGFYSLIEGQRTEVGTTVTMRLRPSAEYLLYEDELTEIIRRFADFLSTPIFLNGAPQPVNQCAPPWEQADPVKAYREFVQRTEGYEPLHVIPLTCATMKLPHDRVTIPLRGCIYIPPFRQRQGHARVYIRNMFVTDAAPGLLPHESFFNLVLESPSLRPTASREAIVQDHIFDAVSRSIHKQLCAGLRKLVRKAPDTWKHLVLKHAYAILSFTETEPRFFDDMKDLVTMPTNRGLRTMGEYLSETRGTIYYMTRDENSLQERLLSEANLLPAIMASSRSIEVFLKTYASRNPHVRLLELDAEAACLLKPAGDSEEFRRLRQFYRAHGISAEVSEFLPAELPCVLISSECLLLARDVETSIDAGDYPDAVANALRIFVDDAISEHSGKSVEGTLHLNARCPLVRRLAAQPVIGARHAASLKLLFEWARVLANRPLTIDAAVASFRTTTDCLQELLS